MLILDGEGEKANASAVVDRRAVKRRHIADDTLVVCDVFITISCFDRKKGYLVSNLCFLLWDMFLYDEYRRENKNCLRRVICCKDIIDVLELLRTIRI